MGEVQTRKRNWNSEQYPKVVTVRVSTGEHGEIHRVAGLARLSASRLLVRSLLDRRLPEMSDTPPPTKEERAELEFLLYELHKIGVNLNQLAHRNNRARLIRRFPPPRRQIDSATTALEGLMRLIRNRL